MADITASRFRTRVSPPVYFLSAVMVALGTS